MGIQYLGHLPHSDSLYNYLKYDIQPQLSQNNHVEYSVCKLNGSNDVYLYEERYSHTKFIGKFFLSRREPDRAAAARKLNRECHHLTFMRSFGFDHSPHYIARPLGCNHDLNELLIVEFCNGELLSHIIERSIRNHDHKLLYDKLTALAFFLSKFHNKTVNEYQVDFGETCSYMDTLIGKLISLGVISQNEANEFYYLKECWRRQSFMWEDRQVIVHGDATPENFLFGDNLHVISFDLERLRRADRIFDTGRVAGELAHSFMAMSNNRYLAEPFIGHFLWEYACHFPDRDQAFRAMSKRIAFYMGITFLRIARNSWLGWEYRKKLIVEAKHCLRRYQP